MPDPKHSDIAQNLSFERRWFRIEKTAWVVIAALLLGASLGLTGPGPLALRTVADGAGSLEARYAFMLHARNPATIHLTLGDALTRDGEVRLHFNGDFGRRALIQSSRPAASAQVARSGSWAATFKVPRGERAEIVLTQMPDGLGGTSGRIAVEGGAHVDINQFVLP